MTERLGQYETQAYQQNDDIAHDVFCQMWELTGQLAQSFPEPPAFGDLLLSMRDDREAHQGTLAKSQIELLVAQASCKHLERSFTKGADLPQNA